MVDESSEIAAGAANPNLYYANAVNSRVHSSTGVFDRNTDGVISAAITNDINFLSGGANIPAGMNDLRSRFTSGDAAAVTGGRFAFIFTDAFDDPGELETAAQALKDADVSVIAVTPQVLFNLPNLELIASSPELALVLPGRDPAGDAAFMLSALTNVGAVGRSIAYPLPTSSSPRFFSRVRKPCSWRACHVCD